MEARLFRELSAPGNQLGISPSSFSSLMQRMAILPLTEVEIIVGDNLQVRLRKVLWTVENRKEYAEGIREMLLDPKGAEKYIPAGSQRC